MKWYQKLNYKLKATAVKAAATWYGPGFDFRPWQGRTFWGIDNSQLATNETIFSAITRISNSLAVLPVKLYKSYDVVFNDVSDLVSNMPNSTMTSFDFVRNMETVRNEKGNAYAIIERNLRLQPINLWMVNPDVVTPVYDDVNRELWYQIIGVNGTYYVHHADMIHTKHIVGSANPLVGINPIKVLMNTNDFDKAIREFSLSEMEGSKMSFLLKYNANVDDNKRKRVVDNFRTFYQENGGILFQEPGVEIQDFKKDFISADLLVTEKITRSRVANVFNMPSIMLNDNEGASYGSNEQLMRMFVTMTLLPIVRQYEQQFNQKLLTKADRTDGYYFKFNVNALLRGDTAVQMEAYMKGIRSAVYRPNEVRQMEDLPPVPEGDKLYISGDLYPVDMSIEERNAAKTARSSPGSTNDEGKTTPNPLKGGE